MATGKLYQEAINEANDLVKMAEERARDKLIESVMPRIRDLLEKRILEGENLDEDEDLDLILSDPSDSDEEKDDDTEEDDEEGLEDDGFEDISSPSQDLNYGNVSSPAVHSPATPPPSPEQDGTLDIKVPKGVSKVTLSVSESKKERQRKDSVIDLDESNIRDLMKLVDGRGTLVERARSIQLELKVLKRELDALSGRRKQLRAGDQIVEEFNAVLRKSIGLKQEIKDAVPGPLAESAKLEFTKLEKEIKEMSTKTLLRSLLSDGRGGKSNVNEMYEETSSYEADAPKMGEADEAEMEVDDSASDSEEEGDDDSVQSALQNAMDALKQAADAAGVDLDGEDDDMEMDVDVADEESDEESEEELDESDLDEGDIVYEIDEAMLRNELKRLRSIREAANAATQMADDFGGGKAGKDLFEDPPALNKSDKVTMPEAKKPASSRSGKPDEEKEEEEKPVNESRRNRELQAKLDEATKAVKALDRQLAEQKLFNAKLLYVNKLMQSSSLTDKQFRSIVEALDSAKNLREAHLLYTSLSESLTKPGRSISEGARSAGGSSRPVGKASAGTTLNEGAVVDRWALLAGIKN